MNWIAAQMRLQRKASKVHQSDVSIDAVVVKVAEMFAEKFVESNDAKWDQRLERQVNSSDREK